MNERRKRPQKWPNEPTLGVPVRDRIDLSAWSFMVIIVVIIVAIIVVIIVLISGI